MILFTKLMRGIFIQEWPSQVQPKGCSLPFIRFRPPSRKTFSSPNFLFDPDKYTRQGAEVFSPPGSALLDPE